MSADKGNAKGLYGYGLCAFFGNGMQRDRTLAWVYMERASAEGFAKATEFLKNNY